jgi:hypothetical protein
MIFCFRRKNAEWRQNVVGELVLTEKEYVRDLKITYETFNLHNPTPLEARGIDVKVVFGNILEVCVKLLKAVYIAFFLSVVGQTRCTFCLQFITDLHVSSTICPSAGANSAQNMQRLLIRNKLKTKSASCWSYYTDTLRSTVNKTLASFLLTCACSKITPCSCVL